MRHGHICHPVKGLSLYLSIRSAGDEAGTAGAEGTLGLRQVEASRGCHAYDANRVDMARVLCLELAFETKHENTYHIGRLAGHFISYM